MIIKTDFEDRVINGTTLNYGADWSDKEKLFDISPTQFLAFAEEELAEKSDKGLINALSNIKRALDSQIDIIIYEHGYRQKAKKQKWKFPNKILFLKERRIFAPRILEKINSLRNLLEHNFQKPDREKVEDAVDMVALFIVYLKRLKRVPDVINLGLDEKSTQSFQICFDKKNLAFKVMHESKEQFTIQEEDRSFKRISKLFYGTHPATFSLVSRAELMDNNY